MGPIDSQQLLRSLGSVSWDVARRTYGSSHATWIGLMVQWWVRLDPASHTVMDGAPSFGNGRKGLGDALFCLAEKPVGVLEIEGSEPEDKIWTIGQYFKSRRQELHSIRFGMLALYSYEPRGVGEAREFPPALSATAVDSASRLTRQFPGHSVIVIGLDRKFGRHTGLRGTSDYYSGTLAKVTGLWLQDGKVRDRRVLFEEPVAVLRP